MKMLTVIMVLTAFGVQMNAFAGIPIEHGAKCEVASETPLVAVNQNEASFVNIVAIAKLVTSNCRTPNNFSFSETKILIELSGVNSRTGAEEALDIGTIKPSVFLAENDGSVVRVGPISFGLDEKGKARLAVHSKDAIAALRANLSLTVFTQALDGFASGRAIIRQH